jgi:mRNA deadenylase 3'-5' endonuclease subunit Ccr4
MAAANQLVVTSWNVLAREYSMPAHLPRVDPGVLDWRRRSADVQRVYQEHASASTSVFMLQEVDEFAQFHEPVLRDLGFLVFWAKVLE